MNVRAFNNGSDSFGNYCFSNRNQCNQKYMQFIPRPMFPNPVYMIRTPVHNSVPFSVPANVCLYSNPRFNLNIQQNDKLSLHANNDSAHHVNLPCESIKTSEEKAINKKTDVIKNEKKKNKRFKKKNNNFENKVNDAGNVDIFINTNECDRIVPESTAVKQCKDNSTISSSSNSNRGIIHINRIMLQQSLQFIYKTKHDSDENASIATPIRRVKNKPDDFLSDYTEKYINNKNISYTSNIQVKYSNYKSKKGDIQQNTTSVLQSSPRLSFAEVLRKDLPVIEENIKAKDVGQQSKKKSRKKKLKKTADSTLTYVTNEPKSKKFNKPIKMDLLSFLSPLPRAKSVPRKSLDFVSTSTHKSNVRATKALPSVFEHIGKQRLVPKVKKPTPLKRAILEDRIIRNEQRLKQRASSAPPVVVKTLPIEKDQRHAVALNAETILSPTVASKTPISKESVSRRLIYQRQTEVDSLLIDLLAKLAFFHDRAYVEFATDDFRQKRSRRLVCGLHEVSKHIRLGQLKTLIVARDLEGRAGLYEKVTPTPVMEDHNLDVKVSNAVDSDSRVPVVSFAQSSLPTETVSPENQVTPKTPSNRAGLGEVISRLVSEAKAAGVPVFFSLVRRRLAYLCHKPKPVSAVGILSFAGVDEAGAKLLQMYREPSLMLPLEADGNTPNEPTLGEVDEVSKGLARLELNDSSLKANLLIKTSSHSGGSAYTAVLSNSETGAPTCEADITNSQIDGVSVSAG